MTPYRQSPVFSDEEWHELTQRLGLSSRQIQIVRQVVEGYSDKQISIDLQMAVPTIRSHLRRLFARFNVQNRSELLLLFLHEFRRACRAARCPR